MVQRCCSDHLVSNLVVGMSRRFPATLSSFRSIVGRGTR